MWGTPAILTGCKRVSKRPGLPSLPKWPYDTARQRAVFSTPAGLCMPSRQGCLEPGTAAFMGCGSARQTGCMRQLPGKHRRIRQAAEWLFRPAHGVWGARVCGGGGGSDVAAPLWLPPRASSWGSWLGPAHGQQAKAKGGATKPKKPTDTGREGTGNENLPYFSFHLWVTIPANISTWSLLSVHSGPSNILLQTFLWPGSCSVQGPSLC